MKLGLPGEDLIPEYRICILDFGRKAGVMNRDGDIICWWPVSNPNHQVVIPPKEGKVKKPKKGGGRMK